MYKKDEKIKSETCQRRQPSVIRLKTKRDFLSLTRRVLESFEKTVRFVSVCENIQFV